LGKEIQHQLDVAIIYNLIWRKAKSSPTIYLYFLDEKDSTSTGGGENHLQPFTYIS
jgi:hypothetical protein